jgi:aspartate carbamoyltransferase catalytic subunit
MSLVNRSILSVDDLSNQEVNNLFSLARQFKSEGLKPNHRFEKPKCLATLFFEPSTRTRLSFQAACARLALPFIDLGSDGVSSLAKGESIEDTLYNIAAMQPDLLVVRHDGNPGVSRAIHKLKIPVVSAGGGTAEHPTQALLDAFTIIDERGPLAEQKILYVGDVLHSRVAHSGIRLFRRMGAEVAVACPEKIYKADELARETKHFSALEKAMGWATVVIGLRIQKERHQVLGEEDFSSFYISRQMAAHLKSDGLIMHPGPFIPGQDLDRELLTDKRTVIHKQVTNGVFVRMALVAQILDMVNT